MMSAPLRVWGASNERRRGNAVRAGAFARRSGRRVARKRLGALVIFAMLFVLWEFAVHVFGIKEYLLPPPSKVWTEFWKRHET